jgi:hypothetical protein
VNTTRFVRKPFYVDAVRITGRNMVDVAEWCGGRIQTTRQEPRLKYIKVDVKNPLNQKQTQGFEGDWVLRTVSRQVESYKVYSDSAFKDTFQTLAQNGTSETLRTAQDLVEKQLLEKVNAMMAAGMGYIAAVNVVRQECGMPAWDPQTENEFSPPVGRGDTTPHEGHMHLQV